MTDTFSVARLSKLQHILKEKNIPALLVTNLNNIRYLSGFTGTSAMIIVSSKKSYFLTDFRYTTQAKKQVKASEIIEYRNANSVILDICKKNKIDELAIEAEHMQIDLFKRLKKDLKPIKLTHSKGLIESLRCFKDNEEVKLIKEAIKISAKALKEILPLIKEGVEERDIALELEFQMRRFGAEKGAFDFIVASGYRSSMPHGVASRKKIKKGNIVTVDFGCIYKGYNSDITRTFCVGKAGEKEKRIYKLVYEAQALAFEKIEEGKTTGAIDKAARDFFEKQNVGEFFGHGLGHGVGLDVHEKPVLSRGMKERIGEGMVFTIEPGLYFPKKFGVRIEDMILIKKGKPQILTKDIPKIFEI
ncbi:MAG: aminopeptidase P family protein [Candidatus Schekmanbacteria bacterium]|nr:MAG: aminopeptidase P family protein [Candidatus Schekmanbacteria bacterium]